MAQLFALTTSQYAHHNVYPLLFSYVLSVLQYAYHHISADVYYYANADLYLGDGEGKVWALVGSLHPDRRIGCQRRVQYVSSVFSTLVVLGRLLHGIMKLWHLPQPIRVCAFCTTTVVVLYFESAYWLSDAFNTCLQRILLLMELFQSRSIVVLIERYW